MTPHTPAHQPSCVVLCGCTSSSPPCRVCRYKLVPEDELPLSESLKLTKDRFMVAWQGNIVPDLMVWYGRPPGTNTHAPVASYFCPFVVSWFIQAGKRLLVSAHGNSLRALVMHLDDISKEVIPSLNVGRHTSTALKAVCACT